MSVGEEDRCAVPSAVAPTLTTCPPPSQLNIRVVDRPRSVGDEAVFGLLWLVLGRSWAFYPWLACLRLSECSVSLSFTNTRNVEASELRKRRNVRDGLGDKLLFVLGHVGLSLFSNLAGSELCYLEPLGADVGLYCSFRSLHR